MRSSAVCSRSLCFGLALVAVAVSAASRADETPTLEQLLAGMASTSGVVTVFRESKELSLLTRPLESEGLLYFAPPDRLARFTLEPAVSSLVIDGERLSFREGESDSVLDLSGNPMARVFVDNFIVLFNGDFEALRERYKATVTGVAQDWTLTLSPRRAPLDGVIQVVTLHGNAQGITRMVMRGLDGDVTTTLLDAIERDRAFTSAELERLFREGAPLTRDGAHREAR